MGGASFAYSAIPPMVRPSEAFAREAMPRFESARALPVELHAGDLLYLPIYWWHGVSGGPARNLILCVARSKFRETFVHAGVGWPRVGWPRVGARRLSTTLARTFRRNWWFDMRADKRDPKTPAARRARGSAIDRGR
jgi:hypothetical protein